MEIVSDALLTGKQSDKTAGRLPLSRLGLITCLSTVKPSLAFRHEARRAAENTAAPGAQQRIGWDYGISAVY